MNLNHWHRIACMALLLPVLAASGCTGTDVLTPTTGPVIFEVDVVNVPEGYRFETARIRINQVFVRPADEGASTALGQYPVGILPSFLTINFNVEEPLTRDAALHAGTYRIESLFLNNINFRDTDPIPDPPPATCAEYIRTYRSGEFGAVITNFGGDVLITVSGTEETTVSVVIDWGLLTEAIQNSWLCDQWFCGDDDWCLIDFDWGFDEGIFNSLAPGFLEIN